MHEATLFLDLHGLNVYIRMKRDPARVPNPDR